MLDETTVRQNVQKSISESLGVRGWNHLDAIILASLAIEEPVLLIGTHGTAKTYLVEQIATSLDMSFRHYNASLINYDDLVGIPIPESDAQQLRFITTPGAIWDAEFVFFDEISRCRPDLQNKLFPIIHEKRVVGMNLSKLHFRWAAMNPPSPDNPDIDVSASEYYLGSEPLDPALTDRFAFIVSVPNWHDLSRDDRRALLNPQPTGEAIDFYSLIESCRATLNTLDADIVMWLGDYVVCVMDLLERAGLAQSPRRARTFIRIIQAIHAARLVLEGEEADLDTSVEMGILYGLPNTATEVPPSVTQLRGIHKQAWDISHRLDDDRWRMILEEPDVIQRILLGRDLDLPQEELARLVTQAFTSVESDARKMGLATVIYLAMHEHYTLTPAAWEPIIQLASPVLTPSLHSRDYQANSNELQTWNSIRNFVLRSRTKGGERQQIEANYVLAGLESLWQHYDWSEALQQFQKDLDVFGLIHLEDLA
jgi:MoxR-like ATPase